MPLQTLAVWDSWHSWEFSFPNYQSSSCEWRAVFWPPRSQNWYGSSRTWSRSWAWDLERWGLKSLLERAQSPFSLRPHQSHLPSVPAPPTTPEDPEGLLATREANPEPAWWRERRSSEPLWPWRQQPPPEQALCRHLQSWRVLRKLEQLRKPHRL